MERDFSRYAVFKWTDVQKCFTLEEQKQLAELGRKFQRYRRESKRPWECVVIEHDWPEYEQVWELIQERADGEIQEEYATGWDAAKYHCQQYDGYPLVRGLSHWCRGWNDYMAFQINKE